MHGLSTIEHLNAGTAAQANDILRKHGQADVLTSASFTQTAQKKEHDDLLFFHYGTQFAVGYTSPAGQKFLVELFGEDATNRLGPNYLVNPETVASIIESAQEAGLQV